MALVSRVAGENGRTWCMHSLYSFFLPPCWREKENTFQEFFRKGGSGVGGGEFEEYFWRWKSLMGKGWPIFGGYRFRVFRDSNCKFYFMTLIWLTIYVKTENWFITRYFSRILIISCLFHFIKRFFNSVLFY